MQKNVENKVLSYCKQHQMFEKGDHVIVGVSGGADSICLLFVLLAMKEEFDLQLSVVHVNHGIRPDASEDAAYVCRICEENGISFFRVDRNIPELARSWNCSEEEAGRLVRYESFEEVLRKQNGQKIAVAHHANDRAETMLFHLFRGSGLTGLQGIRPVREQVVRPLLCLEREEIEAYLQEKNLSYRHDTTNDSDDYTRNKIRHHVLAYAEREVVPGCVGNMVRTADILAETEDYIKEQVCSAFETCVQKSTPGYEIERKKFLELHKVLQKRLLLELLKELSPQHKDMGIVHVEALLSLFEKQGNGQVHLPYGVRGIREYEKIILYRACQEQKEDLVSGNGNKQFPVTEFEKESLDAIERCLTIDAKGSFWICVQDVAQKSINCEEIPGNQYTKWFDYDKIIGRLTIRTRREGDFFSIRCGSQMKRKKLKDYMIDEKIAPGSREQLPLLAEGSHVLWLPGYRISEFYKVSEETRKILQVRYEPDSLEDNIFTERRKLWQSM